MSERATEKLEGPWLSYKSAADHTGLSQIYLRQLASERRLPGVKKIGRRVLISRPALDQWISNNGELTETAA